LANFALTLLTLRKLKFDKCEKSHGLHPAEWQMLDKLLKTRSNELPAKDKDKDGQIKED
jgi:hypothetical protein